MLREKSELIVRGHKLLDICLTASAFIGAYFIKLYLLPVPFRGLTTAPNYYIVLLMIIIIWYVIFDLFGLYTSYRKQTFGNIFWNMAKAVSVCILVMILCMYIAKITDISRIMLGIFYILNIALLAISKGSVYRILSHYRKKGFNFRNTMIIGSKERARDVIDAVGNHLDTGFKVLGCLDVERSEIGREIENGIQVIGIIGNLEKILTEHVVDELVFAMPLKKIENADKHIALAEQMGVSVRIIPDWGIHRFTYTPNIATIRFEEFLGIPTMTLTTTPSRQAELLLKSTIDYLFSFAAMILLLPFFLVIIGAIKFSSKGPVFFKQERCGLNGRRFMLYKFRTMVADAEKKHHEIEAMNEADGPVFKIHKDPRIIPCIGTFLRRTGLDELPQLINVIKGEMSLIGPRPPIPAEVEKYEVWQRRRLSMKPGLTCHWQATPNRNELTFEEWMVLDLKYIDNWSVGLDFKIFLKTVVVMLIGSGR
ncbi:MAG: sugar transferase [Thermodesulfobacteriota bacterium]|nr:sugar transferase [Thermodesulfobacteriota bacterium]